MIFGKLSMGWSLERTYIDNGIDQHLKSNNGASFITHPGGNYRCHIGSGAVSCHRES
jgi:hypothetical protein